MKLYPLLLKPVVKTPIWSGKKLKTEWGIESDSETIGEAWMLTVRKVENNRIENGPLAGETLASVVDAYGAPAASFPLLIKLLNAQSALSVQVHPDDAYAARVENDRGKTEMWHILEAEPDSELILGLRPGLTQVDFANAVRAGKLEDALNHIRVRAGETYFIPAGMPHAIGKGILLAEIQQNCDLTYRIWDYNRLGTDGKPRELHVEKALDVVRPFSVKEVETIRYEKEPDADRTTVLAACKNFRVERREINGAQTFQTPQGLCHLLCVNGEGKLECDGTAYPVCRGSSYLLPPAKAMRVSGNLTVLRSMA